MTISRFGISPEIQSRGRARSRNDGVADPQPTPLLTLLTSINPPIQTQAALSTFHDPARNPTVHPRQHFQEDHLNPSERSELCREHRRTRIYDGVLLPSSRNRSNIPPVMQAENLEQRPPATPRPSFSLPIRLARQQVHSREIENTGGRHNSISGDTDALPVQNLVEEEEGEEEEEEDGLRAWKCSAWIMHHRAWRAALDPAAYDQLMRYLGMPNTPTKLDIRQTNSLAALILSRRIQT
jgi:hypothetical protein